MDLIIHKLSSASSDEIIQHIISTYQRQGHVIVNFLYFANAMTYRLFEANGKPKTQNSIRESYKKALLESDFLLPDGIALQLWSKWTAKKRLNNLNGTDLTPKMLDYLSRHTKTSVYVYSLYDPRIQKGEEWLQKGVNAISHKYPHLHIAYAFQSLYPKRGADFPWDEMKKVSEADSAEVKLFLNCTGSPFQELWVEEYKDFFKDNRFLVMNVGGFLDFVSGFEKRAPQWVVKARVLETFWRICTNPRKNLKKFLAMFGIFRILSRTFRLKKTLD